MAFKIKTLKSEHFSSSVLLKHTYQSWPASTLICQNDTQWFQREIIVSMISASKSSNQGPSSSQVAQTKPAKQVKKSKHTPLHLNVVEFTERIAPTSEEIAWKNTVIRLIKAAVRSALVTEGSETIKVEVFGSFASGLATWQSDIDLVITGITEPDPVSGLFEPNERVQVLQSLNKVARELRKNRKLGIKVLRIFRDARIPIIKMQTDHNVWVDISVGGQGGPRAAKWVTEVSSRLPALRPLVLVIKSLLRYRGLHEVSSGGLSGYSLTNMVAAHLQEEIKAQRDISDYGEALYGFLVRYCDEFSYTYDAVSVASGGIVRKAELGFQSPGRFANMPSADQGVPCADRLVVDDPLTGRDIAGGSYRVDLVAGEFARGARSLEELVSRVSRGSAIKQLNYLSALFDVRKMCARSYGGTLDDMDFREIEDNKGLGLDELLEEARKVSTKQAKALK